MWNVQKNLCLRSATVPRKSITVIWHKKAFASLSMIIAMIESAMELHLIPSSLALISPMPTLRFERLNTQSNSVKSALSVYSVRSSTEGSFFGSP